MLRPKLFHLENQWVGCYTCPNERPLVWLYFLYGRIYVDFPFLTVHKVCTKARLLGERSVRIREVKGSNPSRSIKSKTSCRIPAGRFAFYADLERIRKGRPAAAGSQSPSGALASPWVPTSRNVYRGCCRSCRIPAGHFLLVFRFNALS